MGFSMGFQPLEERPDYGYLRELLRDAFAKEGDLPWFLVLASGTWKRMTFHKQDTHTQILYIIYTHIICMYNVNTDPREKLKLFFVHISNVYTCNIHIYSSTPVRKWLIVHTVSGVYTPIVARFPAGFCL